MSSSSAETAIKDLYIVRHGETEWNVENRMQGRMDSPLTGQGKSQAQTNGALLKTLGGIDRLWVSPSGRTTETANLINSHVHAQIEYADELMERDCGLWSGLTTTEIGERFSAEWRSRQEDPYHYRPPNGENLDDMLHRVKNFLDDLFVVDWHVVGLVTHGVMSKVILKYFLGLTELQCVSLRHPNDLVYRLQFFADRIEPSYFLGGGESESGLLYTESQLHQMPAR
ncbi:MAG: histidine phosphatase family protein [Pseudomonadota bacterium]